MRAALSLWGGEEVEEDTVCDAGSLFRHSLHVCPPDTDTPFVEDSNTLSLFVLLHFISLFHFPPALSISVY